MADSTCRNWKELERRFSCQFPPCPRKMVLTSIEFALVQYVHCPLQVISASSGSWRIAQRVCTRFIQQITDALIGHIEAS